MIEERGQSWAEAAMESQVEGILIVDGENRIVSANAEMRRMWGFSDAVEMGTCPVELAQSVEEQLVDPAGFMAQVGEVGSFVEPDLTDLHFRDGRIIERSARMVLGPGNSSGRVLVFRDVTQRRRAEDNRRLMSNRLQAAQKLESLGVLAGGIAHEFNNLLMVILGNAGLMEDGLLPSEEKEDSLKEIQLAGRRAADLCNQMLAYAGKGRFVVGPVNLQAIIEEMKGILDISIGKQVHLHCSFDVDLPAIEADLTQVRQVIMNLVTNASEACLPHGGNILLDVRVRTLSQDWLGTCVSGVAMDPGRYLVLEVSDSGRGMDKAVLERIFEPFFSTNFAGRGLGLPAVLGIMRGHSGGVHVDSIAGQGSVVSVFFSTCKAPLSQKPEQLLSSNQKVNAQGKILIVDDEKTVLRVATLVLQRAGFEVETAGNGLDAIEILRVRRSEFSCVILDLTMPVMDGLACSRVLKEKWPELPVILSSGYTESEATFNFDEELAGFLQKPYVGNRLVEEVGKWSSRRK